MIKNANIVCISSIDWDFIWQGHQEIMSTLAKEGNRILFIENTGVRTPGIRDFSRLRSRLRNYFKGIKGIREEARNLFVYSPIVLPFPYLGIARRINRYLILSTVKRWMREIDFIDPVVWTFLPTGITLDIANGINCRLLLYYCIDNFAVSSLGAKKVRAIEKKVVRSSDLVFVTSHALYDYCRQYNKNVRIFPFGVNLGNFEKARQEAAGIPEELRRIKKPIIGYIGGIHKWIDFDIIKAVAASLQDFSFVFVGPFQRDVAELRVAKNMHFLGNKKHEYLPYLIKYFDACIIPYVISDYTKNVYPTKLNEYLSMGKPVISTNLPEIKYFNEKYGNVVYVAKDSKEFSECIVKALHEDVDGMIEKKRIAIAEENSWQKRIEEMSGLVDLAVEAKFLDKEARWKENLLLFYRTARKRVLRIIIPFVMIYVLIFYTPIIWFLAESLKVTDVPKLADAIVVLAGGVGESGKVGQGYEERVKYAVELYKKGFAKNVIFSSGYAFVYSEPLVMKALAVSLGIPQDAVLIEDKARNTYENVKFTSEIIKGNGWKKILLISSPYHMRRVMLVFGKIAKDINVVYSPVLESSFYAHPEKDFYGKRIWKRIDLRQLKGVAHEYISILYYWWKGRI